MIALTKKVVEDWEREKTKRKEKEKKTKEEQDKLVEEGLKERLREIGMLSEQIEAMLKGKEDDVKKYENEMRLARTRPAYIKVHKKYLLLETLEVYQLPWSYDEIGNLFWALDT